MWKPSTHLFRLQSMDFSQSSKWSIRQDISLSSSSSCRAHDTGLIKCDDQVTNKHPALEYLGAPPIEEGSIKLEAYLDRCERYVQKEWPILLEKYKEGTNDKADLENVEIKIDKETSYVNRLAVTG